MTAVACVFDRGARLEEQCERLGVAVDHGVSGAVGTAGDTDTDALTVDQARVRRDRQGRESQGLQWRGHGEWGREQSEAGPKGGKNGQQPQRRLASRCTARRYHAQSVAKH